MLADMSRWTSASFFWISCWYPLAAWMMAIHLGLKPCRMVMMPPRWVGVMSSCLAMAGAARNAQEKMIRSYFMAGLVEAESVVGLQQQYSQPYLTSNTLDAFPNTFIAALGNSTATK